MPDGFFTRLGKNAIVGLLFSGMTDSYRENDEHSSIFFSQSGFKGFRQQVVDGMVIQ